MVREFLRYPRGSPAGSAESEKEIKRSMGRRANEGEESEGWGGAQGVGGVEVGFGRGALFGEKALSKSKCRERQVELAG